MLHFRREYIGAMVVSAGIWIIGWLFPDALWGEDTVCVVDQQGQEITQNYTPEELADLVLEEAESVEFRSGFVKWLAGKNL